MDKFATGGLVNFKKEIIEIENPPIEFENPNMMIININIKDVKPNPLIEEYIRKVLKENGISRN